MLGFCPAPRHGAMSSILPHLARGRLLKTAKRCDIISTGHPLVHLSSVACSLCWVEEEILMRVLPLTVDEIKGYFSSVPGARADLVDTYYKDGPGEKGIHFFKIEYDPFDVIMPKNAYSDYVALHLKGSILRFDCEPPKQPMGLGCWARKRGPVGGFIAWLRGSPQGDESQLASPGLVANVAGLGGFEPENGSSIPPPGITLNQLEVLDRFIGVTGAIWNQPRSVTLVAGRGEEKCVLLLIKRKALLDIVPQKPKASANARGSSSTVTEFYRKKSRDFLSGTLPRVLAKNKLFRPQLYPEDIEDEAWPRLLHLLKGTGSGSAVTAQVRNQLVGLQPQLAQLTPEKLDGYARYRIVGELNQLLKPTASVSFPLAVVVRAFPGVFRFNRGRMPETLEDFREFVERLIELSGDAFLPLVYEKSKASNPPMPVYDAGSASDALFLILGGKFRVSRKMPGGEMLINHLGEDGYFGESVIEKEAKRASKVEAIALWNRVLRLDRQVVTSLAAEFPGFGERLRREMSRMRSRDAHRAAGFRLPPTEPHREAASKLLLGRNLLLIDMDLCTRCDQCVRACAEAHDGQPRFHRANPHADPPLRFGRWEVAAACVHCSDAPCQPACPTGAIALLDQRQVQIHRNRCIGCSACVHKCPFDVIEMQPPTSSADAPNIHIEKYGNVVATKCDLCLTDKHDPPCVYSCPYGAARREDPATFFEGSKGWAGFADF